MRKLCLLIVVLLGFQVSAQRLFKGLKKISNAKGTFLFHVGYQRAFYSKHQLQLNANSYNFSLDQLGATDVKSKTLPAYFDFSSFYLPQFNLRLGYYFTNKYAITFGLDHLNYQLRNGQNTILNGTFEPVDNSTWSGSYLNKEISLNTQEFSYSNSMNIMRLELIRTDKFYQTRNKFFALSANYGFGLGLINNSNQLFISNQLTQAKSYAGYSVNALLALRIEFFRHIYLLPQLSAGNINLFKANTGENTNSYSRTNLWFRQNQISLGFFYYFKPKNSCNDCPVW